MECQKIQILLDDYFDGSLSREEENAVEEHLLNCKECRTRYEDMEAIIALMHHASKPPRLPSREFFEEVFSVAGNFIGTEKSNSSSAKTRRFSPVSLIREFWRSPSLSMSLVRASAFMILGFVIAATSYYSRRLADPLETTSVPVETAESGACLSTPVPLYYRFAQATPVSLAEALTGEKSPPMTGAPLIDKSHKSSLEAALEEAEKIQKEKTGSMASVSKSTSGEEEAPVYTVPLPPDMTSRENPLVVVAARNGPIDIMETIQRLKMNLYLSGESRFIPEIHKIESFIADIAAATDKTDTRYLSTLKTFQEAEQCLVEKKYLCSLQNYEIVAAESPGSLMSFLAQFQGANVNYEEVGDYQAALGYYQRCLEQYPSHYISEEKKEIILDRIDILTKNSMDNWEPLRLYFQAQKSSSSDAIPLLIELIQKYPGSSLIREAISMITANALNEEEVERATAEELIGFFQQYREKFEDTQIRQLFQYKTAELFQHRLMNPPQAILEYSKVVEIDPESSLAKKAKEKIHSLYRRTVGIR